MSRYVWAGLFLVFFVVPAAAAPFPIGSWYGTGQAYDKSILWLDHMLPNGEFRAQFRKCVKGQAQDTFETGRWTMKGDTFTIRVLTVNGVTDVREDHYKLLFHDKTRQRYRYLATGYVFSSTLVGDKFELPACDMVS